MVGDFFVSVEKKNLIKTPRCNFMKNLKTKKMIKLQLLAATLILWVFSNCGAIKTLKSLNNEKIAQQNFKRELPFQFINGEINIDVEIEGKMRNFIFDTGAGFTILDSAFATTIKTSALMSSKLNDAAKVKKSTEIVQLENLTLSGINFKPVTVGIINLKKVSESACTHIDGIIGFNMIEKLFWQIDYQKKIITFTDKKEMLTIDKDSKVLNFSVKGRAMKVKLKSGETELGDLTFDTGFNGTIRVLEKKAKNVSVGLKSLNQYGIRTGAFSQLLDTERLVSQPKLLLGGVELNNQVIGLGNRASVLVGNNFFKDYVVTIDCKANQAFLSPVKEAAKDKKNTYGFGMLTKEGKVIVSSLLQNSEADKAGLKIYDEVVRINDTDLRKMDTDALCAFKLGFDKMEGEILVTIKKDAAEITKKLVKTNVYEALK